jgi:hypothetical protein
VSGTASTAAFTVQTICMTSAACCRMLYSTRWSIVRGKDT